MNPPASGCDREEYDVHEARDATSLRIMLAATEGEAPLGLAASARARGQRVRSVRTTVCAVAAGLVVVAAGVVAVRYGGPEGGTSGTPASDAAAMPQTRTPGAAPMPSTGTGSRGPLVPYAAGSCGPVAGFEDGANLCRAIVAMADQKVEDGREFGTITVPGDSVTVTVPLAEGTSLQTITGLRGCHYQGTAMPGRTGNFAVATGRVGEDRAYKVEDLDAGDLVEIGVAGQVRVTYRIDASAVVSAAEMGVLDAVPAHSPYQAPGQYLTLTSSMPGSPDRIAAFGHLVEIQIG